MEDDERPTLAIQASERRSQIDELGRARGRSGESHCLEPKLLTAPAPSPVVEELSEQDLPSPCRDRRRIFELSEAFVDTAERVAYQHIRLARSCCQCAGERKELGCETLKQARERVLVSRCRGGDQRVTAARADPLPHRCLVDVHRCRLVRRAKGTRMIALLRPPSSHPLRPAARPALACRNGAPDGVGVTRTR